MKISKGAHLVLVKRNTALLMLRDNKPDISFPNVWAINGSKIEPGETARQAAIRELEEETGCQSENPKFLMKTSYVNRKRVKMNVTIYLDVYDDAQKLRCIEGQGLRFLGASELNSLNVHPNHHAAALKAIEIVNQDK